MINEELIKALMSGKKMTSDKFKSPDKSFCFYDESYLLEGETPFRWYNSDLDIESDPMMDVWSYTDWREVREVENFEPKDGEKWYLVDILGDVYEDTSWSENRDKYIINQGRVFKTRKKAKKFSEWEQASHKLRKRIWELNGNNHRGFIYKQNNYYIDLDISCDKLRIDYSVGLKQLPSWFYLESESSAKKLVAEMKNDLKIYLEY